MKHIALLAVLATLALTARADTPAPEVQFAPDSPLSAVVDALPGSGIELPWLDGVVVKQFSGPVEDKTMPNTRDVFDRWCKAQGASILQPRQNNCAMLSGGYLGCAVGELLVLSGSDIEAGLIQLAKKNNSTFRAGWQRASWIISNNVIGELFFNNKQKSVVGALQRCVRKDNTIVAAMIYASIDNSDDLLFLTTDGLAAISAVGKEWNAEVAEKKRLAEEQKAALKRAAIEALKPGDAVVRRREPRDEGMVVEMKPPLAQVQWKDRYGGKATVEWVKLEELDIPPRR